MLLTTAHKKAFDTLPTESIADTGVMELDPYTVPPFPQLTMCKDCWNVAFGLPRYSSPTWVQWN